MSKSYTLWLIRHAPAADRGDDWPDDTKRPLTPKGMARMRQAVRGLRDLDITMDVVLTSPLVRARQTAEIVIDGLKPAPTLAVTTALAPGASPVQLAAALEPFRKSHRLALVGHEPGLGEFAAWLIGARAPLPFKKGAVCCIEVETLPPAGGGQLIWFATPRMLRAVGDA